MQTPLKEKNSLVPGDFGTPMIIPQSPFLEKLGYGTGVNVFRMKRNKILEGISSPWAVKCVSRRNKEVDTKQLEKRLEEEAQFLRSLDHPNIVGFRAYKKSFDGRECLAMEECTGSLGDMLEDRFENGKVEPLDVKLINKVCLDISTALGYLHTKALILHGDIKSFNILVKGEFEICKLCDFGVSQPVDEYGFLDLSKKPDAKYIGTDLWSAPEVLVDPTLVSIKADIFSFGLVIYEMIALQPPHTLNMDTSIMTEDSFDETKENSVSIGTRPAIPDVFELSSSLSHVVELFYVCTNDDPEARPSAETIHDYIASKISDK